MNRALLVLLPGLLAGCQSPGPQAAVDSSPPHRTFTFTYATRVPEVPAGTRGLRLWIPVPQDGQEQEIHAVRLEGHTDSGTILVEGEAFERDDFRIEQAGAVLTLAPIEHGTGRSLCVETAGKPVDLTLSFEVTRFESRGVEHMDGAREQYLGADRMIPLDSKVGRMAAGLKTPGDPYETARALYLHTLERMRYDKPQGGQWGRGDAEWACDSRHGNCTDFHSYFMGLARAKSIPARFEMGFPIPGERSAAGEVGGYHCWAYFWVDGKGWIPVDISEADKHPEKAEYFFGTIDENRVTMTGGRDLLLTPQPTAGTINFFVYPYLELDGEASDAFERGFSYSDAAP